MSTDPTEPQGGRERHRSREMSLKRGQPPTQVPGYEPERFLGGGAYGEVWVARERNTGRQVAIKFYAHRSGLDWSLLSREVEKLAFLFADRYVVQLLGVGWDAEPPYYIMEYLERGSLSDRLQHGPMPADEAVEVFHDVAVGLVHAHGKGVLHCDLKPANILVDQDNKPRLADFGQSRLSTEQVPALGTLFYMAPEQADLEAIPDARWDVYALGALLYCMLTGGPPHRNDETVKRFERSTNLVQRLSRYRRLIEESPLPTAHCQARGVDRALAEIVERCLASDPEQRFPNVQAVLEALDDRAARRAKRPMMVLGAIGPALLLAVVLWFAWRGFSAAVQDSETALTDQALESNRFAAQYVARTAANELDRRFSAVRHLAASRRLRQSLAATLAKPEVSALLEKLSDPQRDEAELEGFRRQFRELPERQALQEEFAASIPSVMKPPDAVASWFFCDARGISVTREPQSMTIGVNFAWRSYFHGGPRDLEKTWRPAPGENLENSCLSAVFRSQATHRWIVAVSTPIFSEPPEKKFLGVVALTVEVGRFVELEGGEDQFAVLVDRREGDHTGVILQHPLFDEQLSDNHTRKLDDHFKDYRLTGDDLPDCPERTKRYRDPLAAGAEGRKYRKHWLAQMWPVRIRDKDTGIRDKDTGWIVIVQQSYETAIGSTLHRLRAGLIRRALIAVALIVVVMVSLWWFASRLSVKSSG